MRTDTDRGRRQAGVHHTHLRQSDVLFAVSRLFARKWHALVIVHLRDGPMGFAELRREIGDISDKMLAESLADLTSEFGVVQRREVSASPTRVEYSLTRAGEQLIPVVVALVEWGNDHLYLPNHE
ncbi:MAG: DNA-binding HxlR family transcriptional regulator [Haloarculaceae archaeon]|jgi:DNA-binding HxlR family transcriptional regulator